MSSFEILIETQAAEDRITKMMNKLQVVPIPAELTAWQREDMKRQRPSTETLNPTAARTVIYPRARKHLLIKRAPRRVKPLLRGKTTRIKQPAGHKRPILRPELFEILCVRMRELLHREVKW
jgi:hypothetical protein